MIMFTFIRLGYNRVLNKSANTPTRVATPKNPGKEPWKEELYRLASERNCKKAEVAGPNLANVLHNKPRPMAASPMPKGTITNLKVWWGKAIAPYKPKEVDITTFAPPPKKHPNHWQQ
jgi:hypothetical protein